MVLEVIETKVRTDFDWFSMKYNKTTPAWIAH